MINLFIDIYLPNSVTCSRQTWCQPIDDIYLLNIAIKSKSFTGIHLNWRRNSKIRWQCRGAYVWHVLPQSKALWSAESEAKKPWQNLKVLYLSYIFRLYLSYIFRFIFIFRTAATLATLAAQQKDSNAHSVDSDILQGSDSSICALQDLTLTFLFQSTVKSWSSVLVCIKLVWWQDSMTSCDKGSRQKKSHYNLNYDSHQPLFYQIAKIERCVKSASIAACEYALIYTFRS